MGLVTAVSGFLTKQGVSLLGRESSRPFLFDQVSEAVRADQETIRIDPDAKGRARVASYTVLCDREGDRRVILFLDFGLDAAPGADPDTDHGLDRGLETLRRRVRVEVDSELAEEAMSSEFCGREVDVGGDGELRWI